jgi:hypothetical protein
LVCHTSTQGDHTHATYQPCEYGRTHPQVATGTGVTATAAVAVHGLRKLREGWEGRGGGERVAS